MADKDKKGSLMISRGENTTSSEEDGSYASKEKPQKSYEGGPETMPEPKPKGGGAPSREQLLANLERMRAQLGGGPASIDPAAILGRGPRPGGPSLPPMYQAGAPTVTPTHGSDAAGPGMGGYHPDPYAVSKLGQGADAEFKRLQQERAQITPKAPTDDLLYQEMLKLYGGG